MFLSIIPVCVTLLLGVMGFIVNTLIQRRSNSIEVITKNRIDRMEKTKEIMSKFIQYSDIDCLNVNKNDNKMTCIINDLNKCYADLRSMYTYTFPKDIELAGVCRELKKIIVSYLNSDIDVNTYKEKRDEILPKFEKEFDLYIRTDWKRIKVETVGKRQNGGVKYWVNDYEDYIKYYDN